MSRYFIRPRASIYKPLQAEDAWYHDPMLPSVCVSDHEPTNTGLVDKHGDPIMRAPDPIGFHNPRQK